MGIALKQLEPEIEELQDLLGFDLPLDEHGICSVQLENGLSVMLTLSPDSEHYAMYCLLLEAPASFGEPLLLHAMELNFLLNHDELGTLAYSDADDAIVYSWTGHCGAHQREKSLAEEFTAFADTAGQLQELLTDRLEAVEGEEIVHSESNYPTADEQARFALIGKGV